MMERTRTVSPPGQQKKTEKSSQDKGSQFFPVVGIGASAGGLEALEKFFAKMPVDMGAAYVVVTHLNPDYVSLLPSLIAKKTSMTVLQVEDDVPVAPDHIYIIPPGKELSIFNGRLCLAEVRERGRTGKLIDGFLSSLATDQRDKAIGIILSGTGSDGTLGIRALKGAGGLVLVQDTDTAEHAGMPESAIATGLVDFVLPPEKMPAQVQSYINHARRRYLLNQGTVSPEFMHAIEEIIQILKAETAHDFSLYKKNTIIRRIERRMAVHRLKVPGEYLQYIQNSKHEISVLFKELLIGVTSFFRDPEAFSILSAKYIPELMKNAEPDNRVRVWVPGCSTGEEAYSIAVLLAECFKRSGRHCHIQVFATDLDPSAIATARAGIYPETIASSVSPERLGNFFDRKGNLYQVKKSLRDMITFAQQNIIKDPPFTKIDLLCCRNLLIYFSSELQKKLIPLFHYSLRDSGILFIGSSETVGLFHNLFSPLDKKYKIFKKIESGLSPHPLMHFPNSRAVASMHEKKTMKSQGSVRNASTAKMLKMILAQSDMPACVIIDETAEILYIHGRTGFFLEFAEGKPSLNLLKMARPGIRAGLAKAFREARENGREVRFAVICSYDDGGQAQVDITVRPLADSEFGRGMTLVVFEKAAAEPDREAVEKSVEERSKVQNSEVKRLKERLRLTQRNLQTTIGELEFSNEELTSANEELQSTNEELQSTNEELETSKEELQSLNEESATVNIELQKRIDEFVAANDDMQYLLESTNIAAILLDVHFSIRRFTSKVTEIFPLTDSDVGRPITHFASTLKDVDLLKYATSVLKDLGKKTVCMSNREGNVYRVCLKPYRTTANVIDGIVITFEDITELKQLLDKARRLTAVVNDANDALTLQDMDGNILAWNRGAEKLYGIPERKALTINIREIIPGHGLEEFAALYGKLQKEEVKALHVERIGAGGMNILVSLTVSRVPDSFGKTRLLATTERYLETLSS